LKIFENDCVYASVKFAKKIGNASRRAVEGPWPEKIISVEFDLNGTTSTDLSHEIPYPYSKSG
jgi:hypothetical protein